MIEQEESTLFLAVAVLIFAVVLNWVLALTIRPKVRLVLWDAIDVGYWCAVIAAVSIGVGYYAKSRGWGDLHVIAMTVGIFFALCVLIAVPADIWRNRDKP